MSRIDLEHVGLGAVWRVTLDPSTCRGELSIRPVVGPEIEMSVTWCRGGCPLSPLGHLRIELFPDQPQCRRNALADVNAKLRDLFAGIEVN